MGVMLFDLLVILFFFSKDCLLPSISRLCIKIWKLVLILTSYIKKKRESKLNVSGVKPRIGILTGRQLRDEFTTLSTKEQLRLKNRERSAYLRNEHRKSPVLESENESNVSSVKPRVDNLEETLVRDELVILLKKEQLILKNRERSAYLRNKHRKSPVLKSENESVVSSVKHSVDTFKETPVIDEPVVLSTKEQSDKVGFTLNEELLALHESETLVAQRMLSSIFVDEVASQQVEPISTKPMQVGSVLDTSHNSLYQELIVKEQWTRKEVMELCQKLGLMVDGAIETINDWSFDVVDAPVLDQDIDIYVDFEIIEELKG
ncbi:hypothetical protein DBO93_07735 [Colwellia sp. Arc7-D]|nr:hypothetical protein DBO93_07735 [Colwellia sp. Arc7-D]